MLGRCPPASAAVIWAVRDVAGRTRDEPEPGAGSLTQEGLWVSGGAGSRARKALEGPGAGAVSVQQHEPVTVGLGPLVPLRSRCLAVRKLSGVHTTVQWGGDAARAGAAPGYGEHSGPRDTHSRSPAPLLPVARTPAAFPPATPSGRPVVTTPLRHLQHLRLPLPPVSERTRHARGLSSWSLALPRHDQ